MRLPKGVLRGEKVLGALDRFLELKQRVPSGWVQDQERHAQLVDAHRMYRWLASGGVGWSGDQLAALEALIKRLAGKHPGLDDKIAELWNADDERFDSLSTELLLADHFLASGHTIVPEPESGTRRPEYLVDGRLLVEAKTYSPSRDDQPRARLIFELCHRIDSGYLLELVSIRGDLTNSDVSPLVKQVALAFTREAIHPGKVRDFVHGRVDISLKAVEPVLDMDEGSSVAAAPKGFPDEDELRRTFLPWARARFKAAAGQMKESPGAKLVVLDVSYYRVVADLLELNAMAVRRILDEVQAERPSVRCLLATRFQGQQFGTLRFVPITPTDLLAENARTGAP